MVSPRTDHQALLADRLTVHAAAPGPALVDDLGLTSYQQLDRRASRVAASLLRNERDLHDARVGLLVPPGASWVATLFGI